MDENQKNRLDKFLKSNGQSVDTVSKGFYNKLIQVDDAIQFRILRKLEAHNVIRTSKINKVTISEDTNISRKTLYNNPLLEQYIESYNVREKEEQGLYDNKRLKCLLDDANDKIRMFVQKDIEHQLLLFNTGNLNSEIKRLSKRIHELEIVNQKLHKELENK